MYIHLVELALVAEPVARVEGVVERGRRGEDGRMEERGAGQQQGRGEVHAADGLGDFGGDILNDVTLV
eukprot:scaffold604_cov79-Isochrysis_galbana.AAC.1